ncbi:HAD family hydrolase [Gordonia neofelifaecis]|uniref:HAD family hydrolase n=1 Tax=Gordonia neofelifaecis TaxID=945692 RepID=UPI0002D89754|nr:HAD hydrolase-like protein [Gordonia neofelifaecis]
MRWSGAASRPFAAWLAAGDTVVDVQAANNAGATSVGVLTGQTGRGPLEAAGADHVLDSIAGIPGLLGPSRT